MRGGAARTVGLLGGAGLADKTKQVASQSAETRKENEEKLREAIRLPAGEKLSEGDIESVSEEDLIEVFRILSVDGNGAVHYKLIDDFLEMCFNCSPVELDSLHQHTQRGVGGVLRAAQLHHALQVKSVKSLFMQTHREKVSRAAARQSARDSHLERGFFVDRVSWRVKRDDAFGTLPFTAFYLIIFCVLMVYHLQIWKRQELERGLENWFESNAQHLYGPFVEEHVYSADSFRIWLQRSGLKSMFGYVVGSANQSEELQMATANVLLGDVQIFQERGDSYEKLDGWLLGSSDAKNHLAAHPSEVDRFLQASNASIRYYLDPKNNWVDDETKSMSIMLCSYNNQAEMYTKTEILVFLDRFGYVRPILKARAVMVFSYPERWVFAFDAIYVLMIIHTLYHECKDMCAALAVGRKSFRRYWNFWNVVDWATIWLGFINIAVWSACCVAMQGHGLHENLIKSDGKWVLRPNLVPWPTDRVQSLQDKLTLIWALCFGLHVSVATTAAFLVIKFFKGFQANPRLEAVTKTLQSVGPDALHFTVVLVPIYVAFAVIGHVLFGQDLIKFYTLANSLSTGITVLMGEFEWYADLSETPATLPSGMPRVVLAFWFLAYMGFVLLILLNMLLAIVLERYSQVANILHNRADARTLPDQTIRWLTRKRETWRFKYPLYKVKHLLNDESDPAHVEDLVTEQSLKKAFPGMTDEQVDWIVRFLREQLAEQAIGVLNNSAHTEGDDRSMRVERLVQSIAEELHVIGMTVEDCANRISSLESCILRETGMPLLWQEVSTLCPTDTAEAATQTPRGEEHLQEQDCTIPMEVDGALVGQWRTVGPAKTPKTVMQDRAHLQEARIGPAQYFECCM